MKFKAIYVVQPNCIPYIVLILLKIFFFFLKERKNCSWEQFLYFNEQELLSMSLILIGTVIIADIFDVAIIMIIIVIITTSNVIIIIIIITTTIT